MVKCPLASTSKSIKSPTHQQLFQDFPMHQIVYSNINIVIHIRNISKSQKTVLWRFVHLHKIVHSRKPTFTGFFKGSQSSNKTANIGAKSGKHHAHTECSKNYKILSLATLTSILGRPHFWQASFWQASFWVKFPTVWAKLWSNGWGVHGERGRMGGFGIDRYIIIVIQNT